MQDVVNNKAKVTTDGTTSEQLEQQMKVRDVTQVQAGPAEEGAPGALQSTDSWQRGRQYVLRPTPDDAKVLLELLQRSDHATFDLGRKVLMFSNLSVD